MAEQKKPFQPVAKDLLYLKISDAIFAHIKQQNLQAGDKLPSERDMAQMFQTGRNSVREALRVLENRGLIEVKTGKGAFVKNPSGSANVLKMDLADCTFAELRELQSVIEQKAICDAAMKASEEDKAELLDIAHRLCDMAADGLYSNTLDHQFHRKVLEMSGNKVFVHIVMSIRENNFSIHWENKALEQNIWLPTLPFHLEMAQAIAHGDVRAAQEANRKNDDYVHEVENRYSVQ